MLHRITWRFALPVALTAALFLPAFAQSQEQQAPSVAEAARLAREQKKKSQKPARVISDDNLKPASEAAPAPVAAPAPSTEGMPAPSSEVSTPPQTAAPETSQPAEGAASSAPAPSAPAPTEKKESADNAAEISSTKAQLEALQKELDLLQRELPLARDNFYSKPDYAHDSAGKAKLDALVQQLGDKQQDLDAVKAKLAALLEQAAKEQPAFSGNTETPVTPPQR